MNLQESTPATTLLRPVSKRERITYVDILRGFAIFGILVANMASYSGQPYGVSNVSDPIDKSVLLLIQFLITAKFYSLFSFLFGWGMSVQMRRALEKGKRFVPVFVRRMLILLAFGILHGVLIWTGDILTLYAILGLLLLLFRKRSQKLILAAVLVVLLFSILLTLPWKPVEAFVNAYTSATSFMRYSTNDPNSYANGSYFQITRLRLQDFLGANSNFIFYFGNVFGMFLLGLYTGKRRIFENIDQHQRLLRWVLVIGFAIGASFNGLLVWQILHPGWLQGDYQRTILIALRTFGAPALMLFYVSGFILLYQNQNWRTRIEPLSSVGRMALSNYLLQSVVATLIFYNYGLGLYGQISPTVGLILTTIIYIGQIRLSNWWFSRYQFGPMEWVWRTLTYGRRQPIYLGQTYADLKTPAAWLSFRRWWQNVHPLVPLAGAWVVLAIWFAGLFLWYSDLSPFASQPVFQLVAQTTPVPEQAEQAVVPQPADPQAVVVTPDVQAVDYSPSTLAASGDTQAMAQAFPADQAFNQIETLTGPPFYGRLAGSPEGLAAGSYIAGQFERFGLQPAGEVGTFFQSFPVTYTQLADVPQIMVEDDLGRQIDRQILYHDFSPVLYAYAGSGESFGQVAWVDDCSERAFEALDAVGKVAFCRMAENSGSGGPFLRNASRNALEHGATGLLLYSEPGVRPPDFSSLYSEAWVPEPIPVFRVFPGLARDLLHGSGKILSDLQGEQAPFLLKTRARLSLHSGGPEACQPESCQARNVLGVIPGRDPEFVDQVVILGAHYDHMGEGPDGTVWSGANDNASGTAVLLAIARSWKEQGYVPRRTVVFAAWDAEELGLLGSTYYVEHPSYPLENTVAMIQLDMVGAGPETLTIGGDELLASRVAAAADTLGVGTRRYDVGRSDHVPFLQAGVPAVLLIRFDEENPIPTYHRPADKPQGIDHETLARTGQVTALSLLDLVENEPAIESMLERRAEAALKGDANRYLDTTQPDYRDADLNWFEDLQRFAPVDVRLNPVGLVVSGDQAAASVKIEVDYPLQEGASQEPQAQDDLNHIQISLPARFKRVGTTWRFAGPDLVALAPADQTPSSQFSVLHPPGRTEGLDGLDVLAAEKYSQITHLLALPGVESSKILLFPDDRSLRASTMLSMPADQDMWVEAGEIKLVYSSTISDSVQLDEAVARLVLADAGLNRQVAPWLWEGLAFVLQSYQDQVESDSRFIPNLALDLSSGNFESPDTSAWAATKFVLQRLGWQGLGSFIYELGQECRTTGCENNAAVDGIYLRHLRVASTDFESAWQNYWSARLGAVQQGLDTWAEQRVSAIQSGDRQAFLRTVDDSVPMLINEEGHWFDDLQVHPLQKLSFAASPLVLLDGESVLAKVTTQFERQDAGGNTTVEDTSMTVRFTAGNQGYRLAGPPFDVIQGQIANVRYLSGNQELAEQILERVDTIYPAMAEKLALDPAIPGESSKLFVNIYDTPASFQNSIGLSFPNLKTLRAWAGAGESLKLVVEPGKSLSEYDSDLAMQISRHLLQESGVENEWLLKGVSVYVAQTFDGGRVQSSAAANLPKVVTIIESGENSDLKDMPEERVYSADGVLVSRSQAWDSVRYLVENYGWDRLVELLQRQGRGEPLASAMQAVLGLSPDEFQTAWTNSLETGHIQTDWIQVVEQFDGNEAARQAGFLSSPSFQGRQAGTSGAERAAEYIAQAFAGYGLQPVGDPAQGSFLQTFTFTETVLAQAPDLSVLDDRGKLVTAIPYREGYSILRGLPEEQPALTGELVWVPGSSYPNQDFSGKVILRMPGVEIADEIQLAEDHGAAGLILVSYKRDEVEVYGKTPLTPLAVSSHIPVFELTLAGYQSLLEAAGLDMKSVGDVPEGQSLGLVARMHAPVAGPRLAESANVLGVLPGSDPQLKDEVVILGAHYDYVGDDPDVWHCPSNPQGRSLDCGRIPGLRYPGENDNASGVGVLLEIARSWQQAGFQPKRTVLFAAWGAQEQGEIGSRFYLQNPVVPLESTTALIQVDGVGGGDGFNLGVQGVWEQDGLLLFSAQAVEKMMGETLTFTSRLDRSDHLVFADAGIPALLFSWRLAGEDNLPDGLASASRPERLETSGKIIELASMAVAR
ncbi:MAG: M20/M25/M40 family metallo-hydrolase [Anaerolineales bacterium]